MAEGSNSKLFLVGHLDRKRNVHQLVIVWSEFVHDQAEVGCSDFSEGKER